MCGIAGVLDPALADAQQVLEQEARTMADAIAHRGPDGAGVWCDSAAGLALSHRRLAIVDLTPSGAQPMMSSDQRWIISYNGEIYNAAEIRRISELADINWRGTSDTEVILESVARRGLDRTLVELNGMFAMALWDRQTRTLHLARDRLGIKPLFYGALDGKLLFSSELKSFFAINNVRYEIDPSSVASFVRFGYVPSPWSILRGVSKLMPAEIVSFDSSGNQTQRRYWSLIDVAANGVAHPLDLSDREAETILHDLLADAVKRQMISDVPLGAFLSGGVDSSTISALMMAAGRGPVRTFSIGFPDFGFDESVHAASIAKHLGTQHTELVIDGRDALDVVPRLAQMYDEPFADSSQIPTHLVSSLTRAHVTVALSGDGGDELFGGYNRYLLAQKLQSRFGLLPVMMRRCAAGIIKAIPDSLYHVIELAAPRGILPGQLADKARKLAEILPLNADSIYLRLVSQYANPSELTAKLVEHPLRFMTGDASQSMMGMLKQMQLRDSLTYLPDDILQKVDRASMAVALEARPPFLDHRVVELSWQLPERFHIRNGETKWIVRRVLDRYVPRELIDRPKMGFGVPLADWLRGPLRAWAEDLLSERNLSPQYFNIRDIRKLWLEHVSTRRNWAYVLWNVLIFESWRRHWAASLSLR